MCGCRLAENCEPRLLGFDGSWEEAHGRILARRSGSLCAQSIGSLTKRELELRLLRSVVDSGVIDPHPSSVAESCKIPISRAHAYLTDLALRKPPMSDLDAVKALAQALKGSEVLREDSHLSIPLNDAALRIWIERKMALLRLNAGDALRRDQVRLTPAALARVIGVSEGILEPYDALKNLPIGLADADWVRIAKRSWKKGMGWPEAIQILGTSAEISQIVLSSIFGGGS